ncbi:hypothetical protein ADUPG1_001053 [Aduncisulcus paluster]|uniref:LAGLIDADG homing endonuclease n=1 Tax=Aduncisulcus paluster TaxID=2918883 RepID=A0ABQ5K996_9EUKA|nr:hypothetical protein ADUPG1_001053 [Aduncisulcus paluster]
MPVIFEGSLTGPNVDRFEWYRLVTPGGVAYGYAALAVHPDTLELHLKLTKRLNRRIRFFLTEDREWLRKYARCLGKKKIAGITGRLDEMWVRFCKLFGFNNVWTTTVAGMQVQVAEMEVN